MSKDDKDKKKKILGLPPWAFYTVMGIVLLAVVGLVIWGVMVYRRHSLKAYYEAMIVHPEPSPQPIRGKDFFLPGYLAKRSREQWG